ncbi:unnamed protein product [Hyaloperonospora brassicae]|uniref:Poly(A) RNA polymerase mitochondrial-like central palm domain-containing protein n=1 Tax=Hyaloperonospora brassicae TaxID=162125 RepID=A0AAV0UB30_HYABA|nr:unnamed protein product [Hyaloperonospora brassicae]
MRQKKRSRSSKPQPLSAPPTASSSTNWEKAQNDSRAVLRKKKQQLKCGDGATLTSSKKIRSTRNDARIKARLQRHLSDLRTTRSHETLCSSTEDSMDTELKRFAERVALSPHEKELRANVFEDVRDLILTTYKDATVHLYGSSSTGLDTFRSDLDITVGNITPSPSQALPSVVLVDEIGDVQEDGKEVDEDTNVSDLVRVREEEASFSLNLALPIGTTSVDSAGIARRVQPTAASHWNRTLRRRKIRVLRALHLLLNSQRPHFRVKCLYSAKIPILMVLDTKSKLAIDIGVNNELFGVSEHGRSTFLAQRLRTTLGAPFTIMVMFLKEFLHQFELDKPFTGGIGSFRLYVMVAYIFQRCSPAHRNALRPPVSSLLLAFFELYGNKKLPMFLRKTTQLPLEDGGHMNFGGVFRIDDCVETFAMAFDILSSTKSLGSIIYEERIEKDRKTCPNTTDQCSVAGV